MGTKIIAPDNPGTWQAVYYTLGVKKAGLRAMRRVQKDQPNKIMIFEAPDETYEPDFEEKLERRIKKTLSRLKEKGACRATNFRELFGHCYGMINDEESMSLLYHSTLLNFDDAVDKATATMKNEQDEIDNIWIMAMEEVLIRCEPEALMDLENKNLSLQILRHWSEVGMAAYKIALTKIAQKEAEANKALAEERLEKIRELEEALEAREKLKQDPKNPRHVRLSVPSQATKIEALNARITRLEKENRRLYYELDQLQSEADASDAAEEPPAEPETAPEEALSEAELIPSAQESEEIEEFLLPEENIIFAGGHQNLIKKLKFRYPEWLYINDHDPDALSFMQDTTDQTKLKAVVFWAEHMSHVIDNKVRKQLTNKVPVIYVRATNLDKLEAQIKAGLQRFKETTET